MFRSPANQACDSIAARSPRRHLRRRRGAFTLFEVLLALGLCVVLMAAVYAALDLYARFSTAGQDDMQRSQLSRALLKKMEIDIRSVVYRRVNTPSSGSSPPPGGSGDNQNGNTNNSNNGGNNSNSSGNNQDGSDDGSDDDDDDDTELEDVDPADGFLPAATGIVGDSETLVLSVARPHRRVKLTAESEETGLPEDVGDLKSVSYFLAVKGGIGLSGQVADAFAGEDVDDDEHDDVRGLARLEGDRLTIKIADENADLDQLVDRTKLLAEEVRFLEFSYFDGEYWVETWDSVRSKSLPQAIEIRMGFRRMNDNLLKTSRGREPETSLDIYRFVVRIPAAKPYVSLDE